MNILSKFINVVINPVGAACNIQCSYCYIKTNDSVNAGRLRLGTIIKFVDTLNSIEDLEYVNFTWHGGEPFLYPIESYKAIFEYIDKNFSKKYCHVFQTNGTLITDDWIKLFSEYFVLLVAIHLALTPLVNSKPTFLFLKLRSASPLHLLQNAQNL